jgi:hypothetical protein
LVIALLTTSQHHATVKSASLLAQNMLERSVQPRKKFYARPDPFQAAARGNHRVIFIALVASGIGCGGSGGSTPAPPTIKTAPGTHTITVTPTAQATGSSKQLQMTPIQLTLTVNE